MNKRMIRPASVIFGLLMGLGATGLISCNDKKNDGVEENKLGSGIDMSGFDTTADPRQDFFQYANGNWIKNNPIPATESRWGVFSVLHEHNRELIRKILDSTMNLKDAAQGTDAQLVGDFYASGMDSAAIEAAGISPLKPEMDRIAAVKTPADVQAAITHLQGVGVYPLFNIFVEQDEKESTKYALYLAQGGLGLPDRDYYFPKDADGKSKLNAYMQHVANMFKLMGDDEATAKKNMENVLKLEKNLAAASMDRVTRRNPDSTYHKMTMDEVKALTPAMDWEKYFKEANIPHVDYIIVSQPQFMAKATAELKNQPVDVWKSYMRWNLIHSTANFLSSNFVKEHFSFYSTTLRGVKEMEPRWKRVQAVTDGAVGFALGKEYVKRAFDENSKKRMNTLVENVKGSLKDRINKLEWMSDATKKKAQEKLGTIVTKIGYPDKWRDYKGLEITRGAYVTNAMNSDAYEVRRNFDRLGKSIDRTEWGMTPQTINAYYNPVLNEIVFPAGILQPPFFDPEADDAVNYGGIGAVIGHELTHGFDDQGRKYDAQGNLKEWWTEDDARNFESRSQYVINQFAGFVIMDSLNVDGNLTLGENIADLGGLKIAYEAYKKSLEGKEARVIDGFTPDQRFFIGWAQVWRAHNRPEYAKMLQRVDPHSPSHFRVNGPLSNLPEFYQAFDIKEGDPMRSPDSVRASIW